MSGYLWVHSAPAAFCPHIDWAVGRVLGVPIDLDWQPQPAGRSLFRAETHWTGSAASAAALASRLMSWQQLRFEITHEPDGVDEGVRYAYTPSLGIFQSPINAHGDLMIHEVRLRTALSQGMGAVADLLGTAWDLELDVFRLAETGNSVSWLSKPAG